jgi:hypothetical protein
MSTQMKSDDPKLQHLVHEFDALANLLNTLIDHERQAHSHRADSVPPEQEFTTEWQLEEPLAVASRD